jgi:hypothetical protein
MPGIVKPIEEQDHLGTMTALAEYLKGNILPEKGALPKSESGRYTFDLNPVEVFDKKKNPGGAIYAEPGASLNAEIVGPVGAIPGGGIKKTLGNIIAGPWRSRTLETIEKNPKMPSSASSQTWLSKLKGAGLPKDETMVAEKFLGQASPGGKLSREQVADALSTKLPELGITKTILGGAEWEAGQKRLDELSNILRPVEIITTDPNNYLRGTKIVQAPQLSREEFKRILDEHARLAQDAVGKRPSWPQLNIEGLKDYKEEYFHAPLKDGGKYRNADMEIHHPQNPDNLLYIKHSGTLELPDGKKSTHLGTLQNDHAAEFESKKAQKDIMTSREVSNTFGNVLDNVNIDNLDQQQRARFTYLNHLYQGDNTDALENNSYELMQWAQGKSDRLEQSFVRDMDMHFTQWGVRRANKLSTPEPIMLNTWWKHGLKASIKDAVKSGHDYFTWDPAETQMKRFAGAGEDVAQYMKNHYDNNIPGFLKKEYGVEAKKVDLSAGKNDPTGRVRHVNFPDEHGIPPQDLSIERNHEGGYSFVYQPFNSMFEGSWNRFPSRQAANQFMESRITEAPMKLEKKEVWQIPITEEIKKKVAEGQFWSKAAKPGGNHAESVA